ncbi:large conductance mechanosensitive channel protein MscL [Carnimonas nigrificans]|uniref:large conductance mechanosensitive channel protein MscL n=1 Tax=Carnimonas nigrificans TaxID=64323 RepID=UPI000470589B|nr:large conductance mechanosensitive channel protein MscL [Carnimonas nigrificans]
MKGFLKDFREFAVKGNVIDMAIGIVIGAAFTAIVNNLVKNILTPFIGLLTGGIDFTNLFITLKEGATAGPYPTLEAAQQAGAVTINLGLFINSVISFVIVAFVCFLLVRGIAKLHREKAAEVAAAEPTTKVCGYCFTDVPIKATRCPHCTSELGTA